MSIEFIINTALMLFGGIIIVLIVVFLICGLFCTLYKIIEKYNDNYLKKMDKRN